MTTTPTLTPTPSVTSHVIDQLAVAAQTLAASGRQPTPLSWPVPRQDDRHLSWDYEPLEALITQLEHQPLSVLEVVYQLPSQVQATTAAAVYWCRLNHPVTGDPPAELTVCPVCARCAPDYRSYPSNPNRTSDA